jgi:hypothetical protein
MSSVYNILKFTTLESNMSPEQNLFDSNFPGAAHDRTIKGVESVKFFNITR